MHKHATQSTAWNADVAAAHHIRKALPTALTGHGTKRLLRLAHETTASPHPEATVPSPRRALANHGVLAVLALAAFLGAAFAAGSAGAVAVVGLGMTVEQRAWNSALALVS